MGERMDRAGGGVYVLYCMVWMVDGKDAMRITLLC